MDLIFFIVYKMINLMLNIQLIDGGIKYVDDYKVAVIEFCWLIFKLDK